MSQKLPVLSGDTYCNPVPFSDGKIHTNPDPFILRWCGLYYCYATDEYGVKASVSKDMVQWEDKGFAITDSQYHNYWAPSIIYLNGIFYMYYSNIPSEEEDCHQQHLKLAKAVSPLGPFVWEKTFFDHFSIDSHPVIWNEKMYMFYSVNDWLGTEEKIAGTCILLDEMLSPEEFAGKPQLVVLPGLRKEIFEENRFGDGRDWYTIEGACPVFRDGSGWLLYSANAYEHEDYFVGTAAAKAGERLDNMEWEKYPDPFTWCPLLVKNDCVEGTGHNTVTKAPNMVEDWIVYHGRDAKAKLTLNVEQRVMRIDPLFYSGKHMICFGPSAWEASSPPKPGFQVLQKEVSAVSWFAESPLFYRMECWIKADKCHTGARYGIYLDYRDENTYTEIRLHAGQKKLQLWECQEGAAMVIREQGLPASFDYTVPHLFRIQRNFSSYSVKLDEGREMTADICCGYQSMDRYKKEMGRIGVVPYFSRLMVCSLTMTEHARLAGKGLRKLGHFYGLTRCIADDFGLTFGSGKIVLSERIEEDRYSEEIGFETDGEESFLEISRGNVSLMSETGGGKAFSFYHLVQDGKEWFLLNGKPSPVTETGTDRLLLTFRGLKIVSYRYTKN